MINALEFTIDSISSWLTKSYITSDLLIYYLMAYFSQKMILIKTKY